jgi:hypothetical protein
MSEAGLYRRGVKTDELERIWKEATAPYSKCHTRIWLEGVRKTVKTLIRISGVQRQDSNAVPSEYVDYDLLSLLRVCFLVPSPPPSNPSPRTALRNNPF